MKSAFRFISFCCAVVCLGGFASAQVVCETYPIVQSYPITGKISKLVTETVVEKVPVTTYKEVVRTEMRTRNIVEKIPVRETSTREERHTVLKPVTETRYREEVIEKTDWETSTQYREERVTSYRPVIETTYRDETTIVQKPVTTTSMVNQTVTSYKPVTSFHQQTVDMGGFQNQFVYKPGAVRNRLNWIGSGYMTDPVTGQLAYQRGGLRWVPQQAPGTYQVKRAYVPNYVNQTIPTTTYQPHTQIVQKPVTSTHFVNERITRRIPIQTQKMVPHVEVRKVPVTVRKPVVRREVRRIPYQETRYVENVVVKKVPVETVRYKYVTKKEEYPVRVVELVPTTEYVEERRLVSRWVPIEERRIVSRESLEKVAIPEKNQSEPENQKDKSEKDAKSEADSKPSISQKEAEKAKKEDGLSQPENQKKEDENK